MRKLIALLGLLALVAVANNAQAATSDEVTVNLTIDKYVAVELGKSAVSITAGDPAASQPTAPPETVPVFVASNCPASLGVTITQPTLGTVIGAFLDEGADTVLAGSKMSNQHCTLYINAYTTLDHAPGAYTGTVTVTITAAE